MRTPADDELLDVVARSRGTATRTITGRVEGPSAVGRGGVRVHAVETGTLDQYLRDEKTVAIADIDTRRLTRALRTTGAQSAGVAGLASRSTIARLV